MNPDNYDVKDVAQSIALCTDVKQMADVVQFIEEIDHSWHRKPRQAVASEIWKELTRVHMVKKAPCEALVHLNMYLESLCSIEYLSYHGAWLEYKDRPAFFSRIIEGFDASPSDFLDCISKHQLQSPLDNWLIGHHNFHNYIEKEIERLDSNHILWILAHNYWWSEILELLLKQRSDIFDTSEFLNTFLEQIEELLSELPLIEILGEETILEIMTILLVSEKESFGKILDTILRLDYHVYRWIKDEDIRNQIISKKAFQESIAKTLEKCGENIEDYVFEDIYDLSDYPQFSKSPVVIAAIKKKQAEIIQKMKDGFYFSERGTTHPWDLYLAFTRFSCFAQDDTFLEIMSKMKTYVTYCCYMEEFEFVINTSRIYAEVKTNSEVVLEAITNIPLFLNDQDIQLGIARALRTKGHPSWLKQIESEKFMKSNPLILAVLGLPIDEDAIKSLVRQIRESEVPLLMIQEVLANKQFNKRGSVVKEVNKRIPEIVSMIETVEQSTDDWRMGLVSLVLHVVDSNRLLEFPEIRNAIEKRLSEFQQITSFWRPELTTYVNKKLVKKSDKAADIWQSLPDISSLTFVYDDGLHVYLDFPDEFPESRRDLENYTQYDLKSKIQQMAESGGDSAVKILIILLDQLIHQVSYSTYVYARIAGGYDNYTPGVVWCRVLDWVIIHLREKHDATVVKPLIEVLGSISEYPDDEWLSGDVFQILSHYMSNDELNTLRGQFEEQKINIDYWF
ncbi:MAG: hypothetical protein ACW98Y_13845 [Candidatus Thorarchaeota archaeon]